MTHLKKLGVSGRTELAGIHLRKDSRDDGKAARTLQDSDCGSVVMMKRCRETATTASRMIHNRLMSSSRKRGHHTGGVLTCGKLTPP